MTKRLAVTTAVLISLLASYPIVGPLFTSGEEATVESYYAEQSKIDRAYAEWTEAHEARGGDANIALSVRWGKGLSTEFTSAYGTVHLDLIDSNVSATLSGLEDTDVAELWVVDNQPGEGRSVMPEAGDRMIHVGTFEHRGNEATLEADLGDQLETFPVDVVVVSRRGEDPTESRVLVGSMTLFQRAYTASRIGRLPEHMRSPEQVVGLGPQAAQAMGGLAPTFDALILEGADLFFNETFSGNGRTCGTCHPAENNFTIEPRFIATLADDDPLFVAEFVPALANNFEKPILMREVGLILENNDGFGDLTTNFNMRGVPHTLGMNTSLLPAPFDGSTTPPDERTGWSGDGAPGSGTLRDFATGAVTQHFPLTTNRVAGVDFRLPTDAELDAMEAFQRFLGRQEDITLPLNLTDARVARGQEVFLANDGKGAGKCNRCHANAGSNVPGAAGFNANFNTGVEALADQTADLFDPANNPPDGGFGTAPLGPNEFGDGSFNTPSLIEAADTPPFFHNNAVDTIEGAVAFYNSEAFANSPSGAFLRSVDPDGVDIDMEATQVVAVAAFLRVVNALENIRSVTQATNHILNVNSDADAFELIDVAIADAEDAIEVLDCVGLHPDAVDDLRDAVLNLSFAKTTINFIRDLFLVLANQDLAQAQGEMVS